MKAHIPVAKFAKHGLDVECAIDYARNIEPPVNNLELIGILAVLAEFRRRYGADDEIACCGRCGKTKPVRMVMNEWRCSPCLAIDDKENEE